MTCLFYSLVSPLKGATDLQIVGCARQAHLWALNDRKTKQAGH